MSNVNLSKLDKILKETIVNISSGKEKIYEIVEHTRKECINLENEFNRTKDELEQVSKNIQIYETNLKKSKSRLMNINKNYHKYSEQKMKETYLETDKLRLELAIEKEREQMLYKIRNDCELRLKLSKETLEKAENLVSHVGVAMDFLNGDLSSLSTQIEDINTKHLLAVKVLESQEQDRKKIAREIHDGIAQNMSNIIIKAEVCNRLICVDAEKTKFELNNLKNLTRETLQDIRRIIYDLRPMTLDDLGIVPTLERHIKKTSDETNLHIEFKVKGSVTKLQNIVDIALFRITQESLNNIIKHANATNVQVTLVFSTNYVELFIKDDGKGFNLEDRKKYFNTNEGYGISGMRERINLLGGDFIIKSKIDNGTMCCVRIGIN